MIASSIDFRSCSTTRELSCSPFHLTDHPTDLTGQDLAGKFTLLEPVGKGAYGWVYRAKQIVLHRDVAVKVLDPDLAGIPEYVERFCREAFAASRVHHPNAVGIIDFGHSETGIVYIAMEFVSGWTLRQLMKHESLLPVPRVIDLMSQVLLGMEAIHAAGIVHADLKSDNIMIEELSSGELVKVVDFGIARLRDPERDSWPYSELCPDYPRARQANGGLHHICGTPGYIAPEVIRGASPSIRCDVYAAGVVLYQLLTGRMPFEARTPLEMLRRQLEKELVAPSLVRDGVPGQLDAIVLEATAQELAARFASITDFRRAFELAAIEIAPSALPYCICGNGACRSFPCDRPALCLACRRTRTRNKGKAK